MTGDKCERAAPLAAQCEAGNVRLVRGAWNQRYLEEICAFPLGSYADQVDASPGAFNKLAVPLSVLDGGGDHGLGGRRSGSGDTAARRVTPGWPRKPCGPPKRRPETEGMGRQLPPLSVGAHGVMFQRPEASRAQR